ncbi:uncharacterized protein LOC113518937 [Galleria mellonella]|uniref:Uncharacterized protein LOC113518937 n=1 Tax=Galleria mellonella TaxID=7137 RepID=A0A6J1X2E4_GALME|nr:uncharacterized protein LOC113518937 [Galleria mellonella]
MKIVLLISLLLLSQFVDSRVASGETNIEEYDELTSVPCVLRTLQGGDPFPSVVVKWQGELQRLTWNKDRSIRLDQNYKQPEVSHAYPTGGLSGGQQTVVVDPFRDAPVVPDSYKVEDIKEWFSKQCVTSY